MANGYDRADNEGSGGAGFAMGLLAGTVLGAGLGMLFAPKAGSELRNQISEQANTLAKQASDGYRRATENAGEWMDRGQEAGKNMYGKAREAVTRGVDEAQRYVRDAGAGVASMADAASSADQATGSGGSRRS